MKRRTFFGTVAAGLASLVGIKGAEAEKESVLLSHELPEQAQQGDGFPWVFEFEIRWQHGTCMYETGYGVVFPDGKVTLSAFRTGKYAKEGGERLNSRFDHLHEFVEFYEHRVRHPVIFRRWIPTPPA